MPPHQKPSPPLPRQLDSFLVLLAGTHPVTHPDIISDAPRAVWFLQWRPACRRQGLQTRSFLFASVVASPGSCSRTPQTSHPGLVLRESASDSHSQTSCKPILYLANSCT